MIILQSAYHLFPLVTGYIHVPIQTNGMLWSLDSAFLVGNLQKTFGIFPSGAPPFRLGTKFTRFFEVCQVGLTIFTIN